jgi:hypothetical protein
VRVPRDVGRRIRGLNMSEPKIVNAADIERVMGDERLQARANQAAELEDWPDDFNAGMEIEAEGRVVDPEPLCAGSGAPVARAGIATCGGCGRVFDGERKAGVGWFVPGHPPKP